MSDTAEVRKSEFFTSSNAVSSVPDSEYARVEPYVEILECMSRLTYQSIYVIDYWKKNFLYVSDNPLFLCGRTREEVLTKGYDFYFEVCDRSELAVLVEINEAAFRFYNRLPVADRTAYSISYNFHIRDTVSGKSRLIHHKLSPMRLTPQGEMWLALCSVSLASDGSELQARIVCENSPKVWDYSFEGCRWKEGEEDVLTDIEKAIISYSNRGMTIGEIADRLCKAVDTVKCKAVDTVKGYRKVLFQKLDVTNISEAIACAKSRRML